MQVLDHGTVLFMFTGNIFALTFTKLSYLIKSEERMVSAEFLLEHFILCVLYANKEGSTVHIFVPRSEIGTRVNHMVDGW
jgi:hypothetical protein